MVAPGNNPAPVTTHGSGKASSKGSKVQ